MQAHIAHLGRMAAAASAIIAVCGGIHGGVDSFDLCEPCEWLAGIPLQLVHVSLELPDLHVQGMWVGGSPAADCSGLAGAGDIIPAGYASVQKVRSSLPHAQLRTAIVHRVAGVHLCKPIYHILVEWRQQLVRSFQSVAASMVELTVLICASLASG